MGNRTHLSIMGLSIGIAIGFVVINLISAFSYFNPSLGLGGPYLQISMTIVSVVMAASFISIAFIYTKANRSTMSVFERVNQIYGDFINKIDKMDNKIEMIIESKKKLFLNPGISFHYADHKQIKIFYDITFKEAIIESMIAERTGEASGQVTGKIASVVEGTLAGKDTNKLVSNLRLPEMSSNEMFYRYQKETINARQVVLGIEEVEIEEADLNEFEDLVGKLQNKFSFAMDANILSEQRKNLKKKAAEKTLNKLEQTSGWILIEGKFKLERFGDFFKCIYVHPVNTYISDQKEPITISVSLLVDHLEDHSKSAFEQLVGGQPIPLKIYGQVLQQIDRHNNVWDLKLTPLAIY